MAERISLAGYVLAFFTAVMIVKIYLESDLEKFNLYYFNS